MKRGLQIILSIFSLIPLLISVLGLTFGIGRFLPIEQVSVAFDTHYRYLAGYYISLSLLAWWIIPNIEKHIAPLRIVSFAIFLGGVGRLISIVEVGVPAPLSLIFTGLELCFPLFLIWQAKLPEAESGKMGRAA